MDGVSLKKMIPGGEHPRKITRDGEKLKKMTVDGVHLRKKTVDGVTIQNPLTIGEITHQVKILIGGENQLIHGYYLYYIF